MSVRRLAHSFVMHEDLTAPRSLDGARLMRTRIKSGLAASIRRGVVHYVREAAIATDGTSARLVARWQCGGGSVDAVPMVPSADRLVCQKCAEAIKWPRGPVVYRCYDAEDGELIYIGSSIDFATRIQAHKSGTYWWDEVGDIHCEPHPTERAARLAESRAIFTERPFYNRDGVPANRTESA